MRKILLEDIIPKFEEAKSKEDFMNLSWVYLQSMRPCATGRYHGSRSILHWTRDHQAVPWCSPWRAQGDCREIFPLDQRKRGHSNEIGLQRKKKEDLEQDFARQHLRQPCSIPQSVPYRTSSAQEEDEGPAKNFARLNGRMPKKSEKEPIRHLYVQYNAIKSKIQMAKQKGWYLLPADEQNLKAEKRQLHEMLLSFEKDFFQKYNRHVSSYADIMPLAHQYCRFKDVNKAIATFPKTFP